MVAVQSCKAIRSNGIDEKSVHGTHFDMDKMLGACKQVMPRGGEDGEILDGGFRSVGFGPITVVKFPLEYQDWSRYENIISLFRSLPRGCLP